MRMKDKVALISGAASGMGAATARLLAREGATVFVAGAKKLPDGMLEAPNITVSKGGVNPPM